MGSLQLCTPVGSVLKPRKTINMNKFLAVLCLAVGAMADAEADPYYAAYGYGLGAYGLGYAGLGLGYAGAGLGYAGAYGAYPYGVGYAAGYASHSPSAAVNIAGLAPAAAPALGGGYAAAGRYCANSAGVIHCA